MKEIMVEWKRIGDICNFIKGSSLSKNDIGKGGFPIILYGELYTTYKEYITTIKSSTSEEKAEAATPVYYDDLVLPISSTTKEAQIGKASVIKYRSNVSLGSDAIILRNSPNANYMMYYINSSLFEKEKMSCVHGTTIMHLSPKKLADKYIPLPSLSEQQRIVDILDTFTDSIENLKEQIEQRRKQYEFYRDQLLDLEGKEGVEIVPLKEIVKSYCTGATPNKGHLEYYESGTIPWLRTQDVKFNEIYEINSFVTDEAVTKTGVKWIPENCVIVAISGATAGRCAINKIPTTTNQHCLNLEINAKKALYKYVYYCVYNAYLDMVSKKQGVRGDLNSSIILETTIPLPSLREQQRIVSILDTFESSIRNLEAQLAQREKQYEYYRNKLLTFE